MSVGFLCAVFRQQSVGKSEVEVRSKWQNFRLIQQDDEALLIVITFTDGFGVLLVKWILLTAKVQIRNPVMTTCLEVTVSKLVVIFVYFMAIRGVVKKHLAIHSKMQHTTCLVILLYSFINTLAIIQGFRMT